MGNKSLKFFTSDELTKIWNVVENDISKYRVRNEAIMRVAYECAFRVSEVNHLQVRDYNPYNHTIYCNRLKQDENNTIYLLDSKTIELLELHLRQRKATSPNDFIFLSQKGNFISRKTLDKLMKYYCKLAEIEDESKHHFQTLRYTRLINALFLEYRSTEEAKNEGRAEGIVSSHVKIAKRYNWTQTQLEEEVATECKCSMEEARKLIKQYSDYYSYVLTNQLEKLED